MLTVFVSEISGERAQKYVYHRLLHPNHMLITHSSSPQGAYSGCTGNSPTWSANGMPRTSHLLPCLKANLSPTKQSPYSGYTTRYIFSPLNTSYTEPQLTLLLSIRWWTKCGLTGRTPTQPTSGPFLAEPCRRRRTLPTMKSTRTEDRRCYLYALSFLIIECVFI